MTLCFLTVQARPQGLTSALLFLLYPTFHPVHCPPKWTFSFNPDIYFNNSFIEFNSVVIELYFYIIQFAHFKEYNSVVFSIVTDMRNHYQTPVENSSSPQKVHYLHLF